VAAVVLQLFVFDSMRLSIYFSPLAYVGFVLLLPVNARPLTMLLLGFATGVFVDVFEGTAGLHTAVTLWTAFSRRWVMLLTLGRETVEEQTAMPSAKLLGGAKFLRYVALAVAVHAMLCFSLEAETWGNYGQVATKALVSGAVTVWAVWATSLVFTIKTRKKA
jgi:hypothetical protein